MSKTMVNAPQTFRRGLGRGWLAVSVGLVALGIANPAGAQSRREMQMMADIRMLQEQSQQLQVAVAALNETLKALSAKIDEQAGLSRKGFADQKLNTDQLAGDLRVVREHVDATNVRIASLSQEVEGLRVSLPRYTAPPATSGDPANPNAEVLPPIDTGTATPPRAGPPAMPPQRMYDMAWTDYTAGQWALCITGFENYLRSFPRSEFADEAQFYIGECNYSDGKFTEAVDAYTTVINDYPTGESVPNAYYKRGIAQERLGQPDRARESFDAVIKAYPDSDAARLAKQRMAQLEGARPPGRD